MMKIILDFELLANENAHIFDKFEITMYHMDRYDEIIFSIFSFFSCRGVHNWQAIHKVYQ